MYCLILCTDPSLYVHDKFPLRLVKIDQKKLTTGTPNNMNVTLASSQSSYEKHSQWSDNGHEVQEDEAFALARPPTTVSFVFFSFLKKNVLHVD